MDRRPTCEELEARVRELEAKLSLQDRVMQAPGETDASYRTIVDNTTEGIILQEASGKILIWNKTAEKVFGVSSEEALGHTSTSRGWNTIREDGSPFTGDEHPSVRSLSEGVPFKDVVMGVRGASGEVCWISINTIPLFRRGEPGPYAVVITFSDISERKNAEDALQENERRFKELTELLPQGIYEASVEGVLTYANGRALEMFGYTREDLEKGINVIDMLVPGDRARAAAALRRVLEGTSTGNDFQYEVLKRDGTTFAADIYSSPIIRQGRAVGMRGVIVDVTERRRAADELRKSEALLLESQSIAHLGSWELDLVTNRLTWSEEVYRIFGLRPGEFEASYEAFIEAVHPEDRASVNAAYIESLKDSRDAYETEHRVVRKSTGEVRYVHEKCTHFRDASGKVVRSVGMVHDITDRRQAEEEIRRREDLFRAAFESAPVGMAIIDAERRFVKVNEQLCSILGYRAHELEGKPFNAFTHSDDREGGRERWKQLLSGEADFNWAEKRYVHKEGRVVWTLVSNSLISSREGKPLHFVSHLLDITDRKQAEADRAKLQEQLNQAQKMESVGRLAGGVAHDLNNLLSPIMGYGEMLQMDIDPQDGRREAVDQIIKAARRARDVVRQLLSFSRKQTMVATLADLNQVMRGFEKLLRRTIREDIEIRVLLAEGLPPVRVDTGQMEQVIMNLAVNAQDAMPHGGALTIRTESRVLDEGFCARHPGSRPGAYAMLSVSDTGAGMDDETAQHIFEPFFTTKGEHGTGLGLASVYGIVKQHDGYISVETGAGKGTTFRVYIPATDGQPQVNEAEGTKTDTLQGSETVLIAEDNDQIRVLGQNLLGRLGYNVLVAENGRDALEVLRKREGRVDLLLTDVVMPDMNGRDLFERAHEKYPSLKVLYMSGYSGTVLSSRGVLGGGVEIIQKPFSVWGLAAKVRAALDKP